MMTFLKVVGWLVLALVAIIAVPSLISNHREYELRKACFRGGGEFYSTYSDECVHLRRR